MNDKAKILLKGAQDAGSEYVTVRCSDLIEALTDTTEEETTDETVRGQNGAAVDDRPDAGGSREPE